MSQCFQARTKRSEREKEGEGEEAVAEVSVGLHRLRARPWAQPAIPI